MTDESSNDAFYLILHAGLSVHSLWLLSKVTTDGYHSKRFKRVVYGNVVLQCSLFLLQFVGRVMV